MFTAVSPLWSYRDFILGNVKREFQSRYRNSLLGAAWTVINPASMIAIYTFIFSNIMKARLPGLESQWGYSLYLCAGILTWGLFSEIMLRSQTMFIDNANLIKKVNFPRICLPFSLLATALLNFSIIFTIFSFVLILLNAFPGWAFLALIPLLFILVTFAMCLGIILGTLNVFFRDVGQFVGIFMTFWFWLTPIVYPIDILPSYAQSWMRLNPMATWITEVQAIIVFGQWPHWLNLMPMIIITIAVLFLSDRIFKRLSNEMVDEL